MTQTELIMEHFREASLPPSAIDRLLGLPRGRSRATVVASWREEKERYRLEGKRVAGGGMGKKPAEGLQRG